MEFRQVKMEEAESVYAFYERVIDDTPEMDKHAQWKHGMHPTEDMMEAYIRNNNMYALYDGEVIAGAMAVTLCQGDAYHDIPWQAKLLDDEVAVIHILAVNPQKQHMGVGRQLIDEAVKLAREKKRKAVRLDAIATNTPAHHMYEGKGFTYVGKEHWFAENTGWIDFYLYEYLLV